MIIDLIIDRKDGVPYNAGQFYRDTFDYGEIGWGITAAMDGGTEQDVKRELCEYINSVNWL